MPISDNQYHSTGDERSAPRARAFGKKEKALLRPILLVSLLLRVCLVGSALADDLVDRAHTPPQSPFRAIGLETLEWPRTSAEYEGRATISAKYRFVYDEENGYEQGPHLFLVPDLESQSKLPYLTRWVYESDVNPKKVQWTEKAEEIWVTNVAEAAVVLLGQEVEGEAAKE